MPAIDSLELTERKGPPPTPGEFQLAPVITEVPPPSATNAGGAVSLYDFTDRHLIESLDTHAEEVYLNIYFDSCHVYFVLQIILIKKYHGPILYI